MDLSSSTIPPGLKDLPPSIPPRPASWLTPAPPIGVGGDDWSSCPWVNGSGTWEDPYIFCNLSIDAGGAGSCIAVTSTNKYFRVINCTLTNSGTVSNDAGIYLSYAGNGTLLNNTCIGNVNGINFNGGCNNNTLINNTCVGNTQSGIELGGINNVLTGNNCTGNDDGIQMGSPNNTLSGNICTGNANNGIFILSNNNNLTNNICNGNGDGFSLWGASYNTFTGNNCTGNNDGFSATYYSDFNIFVNNTCVANPSDGFLFYGTSNNLITCNNCTGNGRGIEIASSCKNNIIISNNFTDNGEGVYLRDASNNNTIIENDCGRNLDVGIYLESSNNNTMINNSCEQNYYSSIILSSSNNNTLINNICTKNVGTSWTCGIVLYQGSNDNLIVDNNCSRNAYAGIRIVSSNKTLITGNNCSRNTAGILLEDSSFFNNVTSNYLFKCSSSPVTNNNPSNNVHDNFIIYFPSTTFTTNETILFPGESVNFTSTTIGGAVPISYQWDFKDGTGNSTEQDPIHPFTSEGTRLVTLTAIDVEGDVSVYQMNVFVYSLPVASFEIFPLDTDHTQIQRFYHTSKGGLGPYLCTWNFGDGTPIETQESGIHDFVNPGNYTITLTATDSLGRSAICQHTIVVLPRPPDPFLIYIWVCIGGICVFLGIAFWLKQKKMQKDP